MVLNSEYLAFLLVCKMGKLPTSYLGLPLGASFKLHGVCEVVKERVIRRLVVEETIPLKK